MDTPATLELADSAEMDNLIRYYRHQRFVRDIDEAARRAAAALRLELALLHHEGDRSTAA